MVGIPRPPGFFRATGTVDSTAILDESVGAVDVATTLVYDMTAKDPVVGADSVLVSDSTASNVNKKATLTVVGEMLAGTVTSTALADSSGVLSVSPGGATALTAPATGDKILLCDVDDTNKNKSATLTNVAKAIGEVAAGDNTASALSEVDGVMRVNINGTTGKDDPVVADAVLVNDSENSNVNKAATITNLCKPIGEVCAGTNATSALSETDGVMRVNINGTAGKTEPVAADAVLLNDSENTNINKSATLTNIAKVTGEVFAATNATSALSEVNGVGRVNINGVASKDPPVAADAILINDSENGNINKQVLLSDISKAFADTLAGTQADSGLVDTTGVLQVSPTEETIATATDSVVFFDITDSTIKRDRITDLMAFQAGNGLTSAAGAFAVGAGDGIDVAADAVSVDVTDFIDTAVGLTESSNNIQLNVKATSGLSFDTGALQLDADELPAVDADVGADSVMVLDAGGATGKEAIADIIDDVAGTQATSALTATSGVLAVAPTEVTVAVGADSLVIKDADDSAIHTESIEDFVSDIAGDGLLAASGVLATEDPGAVSVGSFLFGGAADCTSVTVGAVTYTYSGTPDNTAGEWGPHGGSAAASATALAAGINGDLRNSGVAYYAATANTDTVHVYARAAGTAGNVAVSKTGGNHPATNENLVGGIAVANKTWCVRKHTVTANDTDSGVLVNIPVPFTPTMFTAQITSATGLVKGDITDLFTIAASPDRIVLTASGGTHVIATDVITVQAFE